MSNERDESTDLAGLSVLEARRKLGAMLAADHL